MLRVICDPCVYGSLSFTLHVQRQFSGTCQTYKYLSINIICLGVVLVDCEALSISSCSFSEYSTRICPIESWMFLPRRTEHNKLSSATSTIYAGHEFACVLEVNLPRWKRFETKRRTCITTFRVDARAVLTL